MSMTNYLRWLSVGFASLALAGCMVGPDYKEPKTTVDAAFGNTNQPSLSTNDISVTWWQGFNDAKLNDLVARALTNNHDLRIAEANLREARALYRFSQFDLAPSVDATAGWTDTKRSRGSTAGFSARNESHLFDAGFDATWELDVFGHVRRSVEANKNEMEAAIANERDLQVSVISEVARNYFEVRGLQYQLGVAWENATNQQETLRLTKARLDAGRGTQLDSSRAEAQLDSALATIPPIETALAQAMHRLSVLVGQQPRNLVPDLSAPSPVPHLPELVSIGSPENLLRRRADVRVAERRLAAATARIGVATADLFPRVAFNGRVGLESTTFAGFTQGGASAWSFGPRITWAALDLGHVRSQIKAADARTEAALAFYEKTVLTVLEETENTLVAFGREQVRRDHLKAGVQASDTAAKLARTRFENGAADFLTVLDAERVLLEARNQLAQSETQTATSLVALYKALGGGWTPEPAPAADKKVSSTK